MTISDAPQEIVDYILNFLQGDQKALGSSSLVCHSWRSSSQQALFHNIRVRLANTSVDDFVAFFMPGTNQAGAPRFAPQRHVRHLTFQGTGISSVRSVTITTQEIARIFHLLPVLRSLTLLNISLEYDQEPLTDERHPIGLLALRNVLVTGTRCGLIAALLSMCSPRSLFLSSLNFVTAAPAPRIVLPETVPVEHLSGIETLVLRSRWSIVPFLEIFRQGALKSLDVSCYVTTDVQAVGDFLAQAGHHLERYSLDVTDFIMRTPNPADSDLRRLDLGPCSSLNALTIRMSFLAEPWSSLPFNAAIFTVASQVVPSASPSLETLIFSIMLDGKADNQDVFLRPFTQRMDLDAPWISGLTEKLPSLKQIVWRWRNNGRSSEDWSPVKREELRQSVVNIIRGKLAALDERGMLKFEDDVE